jgi:hypothetical protein
MKAYLTNSQKEIIKLKNQIINEPDSKKKEEIVGNIEKITKEITTNEVHEKVNKTFKIIFSILVSIIFLALNIFVAIIIWDSFCFDLEMLRNDSFNEYKRLIDQKVLIALITGIIVETAIAFRLLAKHVFNDVSLSENKKDKTSK